MPRLCGGGFVDLTFQRRQLIYRNDRNAFQAKNLKKIQINFFSMVKFQILLTNFFGFNWGGRGDKPVFRFNQGEVAYVKQIFESFYKTFSITLTN